MNQRATDWMFDNSLCIKLQGASAYKRFKYTLLLINHLNNHIKKVKCMLLGQMGGSTSHMLASILQEAGYKVSVYLPHLKDFRGASKINGEISEHFVCDFR
jgi:dihydrofolate synthase/folylpolyglutamate synthase